MQAPPLDLVGVTERRACPRGGATEICLVLCRLFTRGRFNNGPFDCILSLEPRFVSSRREPRVDWVTSTKVGGA